MLHTGTVEEGTLDLLKKLSNDENLKHYNLVGGTALSLLIGHRKSIDIDLFSTGKTDAPAIAEHLKAEYKAKHLRVIANAVFSYVNDVKIDMIPHPYIWLQQAQNIEGIRIASLDDIAATKVNAIVQSGQRLKDFADMHFILENRTMDQILQGYLTKYPEGHAEIAKMTLLYHKQIDFDFQEQAILSVAFTRNRLQELNFEHLEPPATLRNFVCNMKFGKATVFAPVDVIDPATLILQ